MAKPEDPGKSEDAPGHNKDAEGKPAHPHDDESTTKPVEPDEPEATPVTVTSSDVGEQTLTHADGAVEPGDAEAE